MTAKPNVNRVWSNSGTAVQPSDAKIDLGWIAEKPPFQTMNWLQNRHGDFINHVNLHGIPEWDALTVYIVESIVKGSDGTIYASNLNNNQGSDPVLAIPGDWSPMVKRTSEIIDLIYPVGRVILTVDPANPSTYWGGVWVQISQGRTIVGEGVSDQNFAAGSSGGSSSHTISLNEIPSHNHGGGDHNHTENYSIPPGGSGTDVVKTGSNIVVNTGNSGEIIDTQGGGASHNNLQPYLVTYIFERTA